MDEIEKIKKEIGERIKEKRETMNLSQEQLAEKLGYKSKTSIHKVEQGSTDLPQSKIVEFARVLQTTPMYLMGWGSEDKEKVKTAARNEKMLKKFDKLSQKKKKMVEDLINSYFDDNMEDEE